MTLQQLGDLDHGLTIIIPIIFIVSLFYLYHIKFRFQSVSYPPGPPSPSILLGHFGKVPTKKPWFDYMRMGKIYGDLIFFRSLRDHILVINSAEAAKEILETQAGFSSDRPFGNELDKLVGWDKVAGMIVYSEKWRNSRRKFHQNFRSEAIAKYQPIQEEKVHEFLRSLLLSPNPEELMDLISTLSQGIMFKAIYGLKIISKKEDLPQIARDVADSVDQALIPGAIAYRSIPFIHLLPFLIPNCKFSQVQRQIRETVDMLRSAPFDESMKAWESGVHFSLIGELMDKNKANGGSLEEIELIKDMGSSALAAAADTTTSATATFFLAMSLYPQVQRKAQEELDSVLGPERLPHFGDRHSLPYIQAIYQEVMRWHPTLPLGVPHRSTEDIIYNGYIIPKGTIIHANIWAITHDPVQYSDPEKFIPERHLKDGGPFEKIGAIAAYGYGRRVCVGRYFADSVLWLMMASVLATVNISRVEDSESADLQGKIEDFYSDYGLCHLHTIPGCKIEPRLHTKSRAAFDLEHAGNT